MSVRAKYTVDDQRRMMIFLKEELEEGNADAWKPFGNRLWEKAVSLKITDHSMQSMRDHMRRYLLKDLETAPVDLAIREYIRMKLDETPPLQESRSPSRSGSLDLTRRASSRSVHTIPLMTVIDDDQGEQAAASTPIRRHRRGPPPLQIFEDEESFLLHGRPATPVKRRRVRMGDEDEEELDREMNGHTNKESVHHVKQEPEDHLNLIGDEDDEEVSRELEEHANKESVYHVKQEPEDHLNQEYDDHPSQGSDHPTQESGDLQIQESDDAHPIQELNDHSIQESDAHPIQESDDLPIQELDGQSIQESDDRLIQESGDQSIQESDDHQIQESDDHPIQESGDHQIQESDAHPIEGSDDHTNHESDSMAAAAIPSPNESCNREADLTGSPEASFESASAVSPQKESFLRSFVESAPVKDKKAFATKMAVLDELAKAYNIPNFKHDNIINVIKNLREQGSTADFMTIEVKLWKRGHRRAPK